MLKRSRRKEPREWLTGNLKNAEGKDWPQFCCDIMSGVWRHDAAWQARSTAGGLHHSLTPETARGRGQPGHGRDLVVCGYFCPSGSISFLGPLSIFCQLGGLYSTDLSAYDSGGQKSCNRGAQQGCVSSGNSRRDCFPTFPSFEAPTLSAHGPFLRLHSNQQRALLTHAASSLALTSPYCSTFKDP